MQTALVMLSGGLDSATVLAEAVSSFRVLSIFFDYGQPSADWELASARQVARSFGVFLEVVDVSGLRRTFLGLTPYADVALGFKSNGGAGGSSRGNGGNCPHGLFGVASTYCVTAGIDTLIAGMHADDVDGLVDAPGYFATWGAAMSKLQSVQFTFTLPFLALSKAEVVARAIASGVPVAQTRSCAEPTRSHCGKCEPCLKRRAAFQAAGVADPTSYI